METLDPAELALLQAVDRGRDDFTFFCTYVLGVRVHPGQQSVVDALQRKPFAVLAAANGWGKTAFISLFCMWLSFYKKWADPLWEPYRVVVLGPEMKHSLIAYQEIESIRQNRSRFQNWGDGKKHYCLIANMLTPFTTPDKHNAFRWRHNKSMMFFESSEERAKSIEGLAPNVVIYDEARRELYLEFVVNQVILPRGNRVPGFRMLLSSTPLADSFDFMEFYKRGEDNHEDWTSIKGSIKDNIFLDEKAVALIRRNLDPRIVDQVMAGEFVAPESAYFISDKVKEAFDPSLPNDQMEQFKGRAEKGHRYVGGIDPAVAEGGDESVVTVWDATDIPFRAIYQKVLPRGTSLGALLDLTNQLVDEFNCIFAFDATGPLGIEFQHQATDKPTYYQGVSFGAGNRGSDITSLRRTSVMKQDILGNFRFFINNGLWKCPDMPDIRKELLGYKLDDKHLKTDRLMAQALAAWIAKDYVAPNREGLVLPNLYDQYTDVQENDNMYAGGSSLMRAWSEWVRNTPGEK